VIGTLLLPLFFCGAMGCIVAKEDSDHSGGSSRNSGDSGSVTGGAKKKKGRRVKILLLGTLRNPFICFSCMTIMHRSRRSRQEHNRQAAADSAHERLY
jgi:hypothetical protein